MTESDLERLFWEEIDGPPSAARRRRIETLVREQPRSKRALAELQELHGHLQAVEEVAPPPELRSEIRREVGSRPGHGRAAAAPSAWLGPVLAVGWRPRLAYATLGALIGIFVTYLVVGAPSPVSESDRSRLSGALNMGSSGRSTPSQMTLAGAAGSLRISRDGTDLVATLLPTPNKTLELVLQREGGGLEAVRVQEIGGSRLELSSRQGMVRLVTDGPASLVLRVDDRGPPRIAVRVSTAAGATVLDRQLDLAGTALGD